MRTCLADYAQDLLTLAYRMDRVVEEWSSGRADPGAALRALDCLLLPPSGAPGGRALIDAADAAPVTAPAGERHPCRFHVAVEVACDPHEHGVCTFTPAYDFDAVLPFFPKRGLAVRPPWPDGMAAGRLDGGPVGHWGFVAIDTVHGWDTAAGRHLVVLCGLSPPLPAYGLRPDAVDALLGPCGFTPAGGRRPLEPSPAGTRRGVRR